ncbi:MAG: glycosyltransferase family 4 protein [Candidatus Thorarchaeota archaeon]
MKILQIISNLRMGGAEKLLVTLSNELKKRGHDITLCYLKPGPLEKFVCDAGILFNPVKKFPYLNYLSNLCKYINEKNFDIIHAHIPGGLNTLYGFISAKITKKKFIVTVHGNIFTLNNYKSITYKWLLHYSNMIVTVSDALKIEIEKESNVNPRKIITIRNGIDISYFCNNMSSPNKHKDFNLDLCHPVIGVIGTIRYVKGYDVLIKSLKRIKNVYPKIKLLIVGGEQNNNDLEYRFKLDTMIRELDLGKNVVFLGERNDLIEIYNSIDVFVLPSRSEGTSLSLLEAMASKKAIVATDVGGTPYVLDNYVNGILVPAEDSDALSRGILKVLEDKDLARKLGKNAWNSVNEKFCLSSMVNNYIQLYQKILRDNN